MKKTILYLSLALGICLPALAMNQEDADLKRALQESVRMAEERIMRESKQTAHEQQRRQEDPELHHALELSRAGLQAEDTFQKELKQAKELSLKESGATRERAAFSRAIGRSVHDSILARIESSESEKLARRLQAQEDAQYAQAVGSQNGQKPEHEKKLEAEQHSGSKIKYVRSHIQEGADCGYWALWNAIHGADKDYASKKAPIVQWRKIMGGLGRPKENISDGDIELLGCLELNINNFDKAPITIIPNIMQITPITKQSDVYIVGACPQSYVSAMRKLQTQQNAQHAFIVGNAQHVGYKKGTSGHWISVRAVKQNNVITWYAQDSGGDGKGRPRAEVHALIDFIMNSDYKFIEAVWKRDRR